MKLSFTKMHGCANDYIYLDCRTSGVPENISALAEKLSARHFSIGADGIICVCAPVTEGADGRMRIFNADGSEGRMCGNGIRCVAQWLRDHAPECADKPVLTIDTESGTKTVRYQGGGCWQVEMGAYSTLPADLPAANMGDAPLVDVPLDVNGKTWKVTCINVGNPHCVIFVRDPEVLDLNSIGPAFEHYSLFPRRTNVEFVRVISRDVLQMRVWERGTGETLACGTGACAALVAAVLCGHADRKVQMKLAGGNLMLNWNAEDNHVYQTGPAAFVFDGEWLG